MKRRTGWCILTRLTIAVGAILALRYPTSLVAAQEAPAQSASTAQEADAPGSEEKSSAEKAQPARLPRLDEMQIPSATDLLLKPPVDWIVTSRDEVLIVQPIQPRPHTLEVIKERRDKLTKLRPRTSKERAEVQAERLRLQYLDVVLPHDIELPEGEEDPLFQLNVDRYIRDIIHHEELLLRRADKLLDEGKRREAFELLLTLQRKHANWPGYTERHHRLLLEEAKAQFQEERPESALTFLEQLHVDNPGYRGLKSELGRVVDHVISKAVEQRDFRRARHFLGRLATREPNHQIVAKWKGDLLARAKGLLVESAAATGSGRHDEAVRLTQEAARVWPGTPNLRNEHRRAGLRFQSLNVGVIDQANHEALGFPLSDAAWRQKRLLNAMLFEVDRADESAHYRTRFFEQWEPTDLGRQVVFVLRQSRQPWESQRVVTTASIVSTFAARLDPQTAVYDQRLASFVDSVTIRSPFEFTIRLSRVPVRPEPLFRFPVLPEAVGRNRPAEGESVADAFLPALSERFRIHEQDDRLLSFRRAVPESDGLTEYHVAEIREIKYDSFEKAIQGFLRGEVRMLPHVPPWTIAQFAADEQFVVRQYAMPVTHVLQFNHQSKPLKNAELRRALAFAIDRSRILSQTVLRDPETGRGRLVTGPFSKRSYASDLSELRPFDRWLALSLVLVAKKAMGGEVPELRMVCAPDPVAEAAAKEIVKNWSDIGISVRLVDAPTYVKNGTGPDPEIDWDIVYRKVRMTEPITDLWPFLTFEPYARVEALMFLPDWLRQELIELDAAVDWDSAVTRLHKLNRHLTAQFVLIPLWEVDDAMVFRKQSIRGLPERPVHPYQDVERWIVEPWYTAETP